MSQYVFIAIVVSAAILTGRCSATDRSFGDIVAFSPNNAWKVIASSPDNATPVRRPWQDNFVYSAVREGETKPHWTREQSSQDPYEGSPVAVVVADNGWVAIHTGLDQLVFIDSQGCNRARVDDIKACIPKGELASHGVGSSGGLIWSPFSLWYFLPVQDEQLFVVRLWWGRQIFIRPDSGELVREDLDLQSLASRVERERAMSLLAIYSGDSLSEADASQVLLGAYLAGALQIKEVIPWLHQLEHSNYVGVEASRLGWDRTSDLDPFSFRCYSARQISRLSLRRLGAAVNATPIYEFRLAGRESEYFSTDSQPDPNGLDVSRVQVGMTAENVLEHIGSPDFVVGECWEYDLAGDSPMTFVIEWKDGRVACTERDVPRWMEGLERDRQIARF